MKLLDWNYYFTIRLINERANNIIFIELMDNGNLNHLRVYMVEFYMKAILFESVVILNISSWCNYFVNFVVMLKLKINFILWYTIV